ncbi:MAG: sulfatase [Acidobacteriota bacterium]
MRLIALRSLCLAPALLATLACAPEDSPLPSALVELFPQAEVEGTPATAPEFPNLLWTFAEESPLPQPGEDGAARETREAFSAFRDLGRLRVRDGALEARVSGSLPLLSLEIGEGELPDDVLDRLTVKLKTDRATKLRVYFLGEPPDDELAEDIEEAPVGELEIDLRPGDDVETYVLGEAQSTFGMPSRSLSALGYLLFGFEAPQGATIELESVEVTGQVEALSGLPSGVGWRGLGNVFRETVIARSPETVRFPIQIAGDSHLELHVGTPGDHPITFVARIEAAGKETTRTLTVTEPQRWVDLSMELDGLQGPGSVELRLEAEDPGRLGFWGGATLRPSGLRAQAEAVTEARQALGNTVAPRGVIVFLADTLRSDHLDAWGYERETAPFLTSIAAEGTRFADNVAQGSWTKVAVPSLLTSLYASSHGISDAPQRLPASVTTLTESFRAGGYATFHTSSVIFSGKNSNLQQGVEVLHERDSLEIEDFPSKTARGFTNEFLDWLETHREEPFFAVVHVFDPHSPFQPRRPFDRRWLGAKEHSDLVKAFEEIEEVSEFHGLPSRKHFDEVEIDEKTYVESVHAWYDGSIRAMDAEISRIFERLAEYEIADDTLFAFITDYGEEFLEHGDSWHGHSVYGEMVQVPMVLRWPGVVPPHVVETTSQSIDLMPTLLELAMLPVPEQAQGNSHVPLLAAVATESPLNEFGWSPRPAFTERLDPVSEPVAGSPDAFAVVHGGWKLIWNVVVRDDRPQFELFDHESDPLDLHNVAVEHPERVAALRRQLESWRAMTGAAKVSDEGLEAELDPEEMERLRALGYIN